MTIGRLPLRPDILYTIAPVEPDKTTKVTPEFIRLPKTGKQCPYTGLSRAYLYRLVLPSDENGHNPPVKSVSLRPRGALRGVRLIHNQSLLDYLYARI